MPSTGSNANQDASKGISIFEHYRLLLHYAPRLLRGELGRGKGGGEYLQAQRHYADLVYDEIHDFMSLQGKQVLEVGGGSGVFCRAFTEDFGAELAVNVEPFGLYDVELHWPDRVRGVAQALPFKPNQFDFVFCREVLEHVKPQECLQRCVNEMYRVTKKGGLCYISIPPWHNPFAGHACMPFHYLPFKNAKRLAFFFYKNPNLSRDSRSWEELNVFPITFGRMRRIISKSGFQVLATKDHHFRLDVMTRIPFVREVAVPVVAFILRR